MSFDRMDRVLARRLDELEAAGTRKGAETVVTALLPPEDGRGPRVRLAGEDDRPFLRMNTNGYLGLADHPEVVAQLAAQLAAWQEQALAEKLDDDAALANLDAAELERLRSLGYVQ